MTIYKSSLFIIGKNIVYAVAGACVAAFILNIFVSEAVAVGIGALTGLAIAYLVIYQNIITVEVGDGIMTVSRFGKRQHEFELAGCSLRANIRTTSDSTGTDSDCTLTVIREDGDETHIDCTMMGADRFYELLEDLGLVNPDPVPLRTTKKK